MERYKHLNAEFQRIARRDKKAYFSDQCKEIEEKNRWQEHLPPTLKGLITRGLESQGAWTPAVEVRNRFKGLDLIECLMIYG